jgi:hypothetical protein
MYAIPTAGAVESNDQVIDPPRTRGVNFNGI